MGVYSYRRQTEELVVVVGDGGGGQLGTWTNRATKSSTSHLAVLMDAAGTQAMRTTSFSSKALEKHCRRLEGL